MRSCALRRSGALALAATTAISIAGTGTAFATTSRTAVKRVVSKVTGTAATLTTAPTAAPSGQTTVTGLLSPVATTFASALTGWTSFAGGAISQVSNVGHTALGALAVTSAGPWTGATSAAFSVTPGVRYSAATWVEALSAGHSVGLALQFRDANGATISLGNQLGQSLVDTTAGWSQTRPVVGIAPAGAVSGVIVFVDYDGPAGDTHFIDDVSLTATSGTPARIAGPLTTRGTNVLDAHGRIVHFHGVDIDGLQYSNTANVSTGEVNVAQYWGANFVRLPLAENYLVAGDCSYDGSYLSKVDAMVNAATSQGMFIMLDLHTNALTACAAPTQQLMPDGNAVLAWKTLAARYKANPLVGFDLYNEPHDISDAIWHSGGTVTSSGVTYQAVGMQTLYNTVRATGATNLVFASGTNWATQFPATAPLTGTTNLIYAAHAYTCPGGLPSSGATCTTGLDGTIFDPSALLSHFDTIGQSAPVMVTEFGFPDANDGRYITNVENYAASRGWVGWDVYAFDGSTGGLFDLWKNADTLIEPAISGMAVITGMLAD